MNKIECLEDYSITSFFLTVASQMTIERMLKIFAFGNIKKNIQTYYAI